MHAKTLSKKVGKAAADMVVAPKPALSSGYIVVGVVLGLVFGFVLGSALALSVGDKSLSLVQHLWNRFSHDAEGERVHFEWLLQ